MNYELIHLKTKIKRKSRPMNTPRKIAIENKEKYYQGNKCKLGHSGKRLTKDGQCIECRKILRAKYNDKNRARAKKWELKKNFNITVEEYEILIIKQNNLCALCFQPEKVKTIKGKFKKLAVDHCHKTNKIRGLLCYTCNIGIGLLKHDSNLLRKAALYCEENG